MISETAEPRLSGDNSNAGFAFNLLRLADSDHVTFARNFPNLGACHVGAGNWSIGDRVVFDASLVCRESFGHRSPAILHRRSLLCRQIFGFSRRDVGAGPWCHRRGDRRSAALSERHARPNRPNRAGRALDLALTAATREYSTASCFRRPLDLADANRLPPPRSSLSYAGPDWNRAQIAAFQWPLFDIEFC